MRMTKTMLAGLLMTLGSMATAAVTMTADQILEKVRLRPDGADIYAEAKLVLNENGGATRTRELLFLQKDYGKDEKLTLYFTGPSDVKGVALQSVNFDESAAKEDDQWIYLPAFRQIRRIAATDKRGAFMGSQFSYIDLDKLRVTDYKQKVVGEEKYQNFNCVVVERLPVSESVSNRTGYHKVRTWVDLDSFVVVKQSFFDARGVEFKVFFAKKVEKVQNIWTVTHSEMRDLVNQRSSDLIFSNVHYDVGLGEVLFQQNIMKTGVSNANLPALR